MKRGRFLVPCHTANSDAKQDNIRAFENLPKAKKSVSLTRFYPTRVIMTETFTIFLIVMALLAGVVFAALHFFEAGYGYLFDRRYGPPCRTGSDGC